MQIHAERLFFGVTPQQQQPCQPNLCLLHLSHTLIHNYSQIQDNDFPSSLPGCVLSDITFCSLKLLSAARSSTPGTSPFGSEEGAGEHQTGSLEGVSVP